VLQAGDARNAAEKVPDVVVGVKSDEIGPQQSAENFLPPRQQAKHLERGPRDVKEVADVQLRYFFSQQPGQEH